MSVDGRRGLRAAVYQADGRAVVTVLRSLDIARFLQLAGEGLLTAVAQRADGARAWDGDEELAAELDAAIAGTVGSGLPSVSVDLDELSDLLEGGLGFDGGRVDLASGEVWPVGGFVCSSSTLTIPVSLTSSASPSKERRVPSVQRHHRSMARC